MTTSQNNEQEPVLISGDNGRGKHHAEVLIMNRDADGGIVFVMQSASLRIDPDNTVERLSTLGERLALPEGWTYRARTLENDLVMVATADSDPPNTIVLDELENNYQRLRTE